MQDIKLQPTSKDSAMCTQSRFIFEYHLYQISYTSEKNTKISNLWLQLIRFSNKPKT